MRGFSWFLILSTVTFLAGGAGYFMGGAVGTQETASAAAPSPEPGSRGFSAGYSAPAGVVAIRVVGPNGETTIAADLSVGFRDRPSALYHQTDRGLKELREHFIMALGDVGMSGQLGAQDDWIAELAVALVTRVSREIPEVVEVRINRAQRTPHDAVDL